MKNQLMLSCRAATELVEKKLREKLSLGERTKLFFHTAFCSACRRYEKQSLLLEQLFKKKGAPENDSRIEAQARDLEEKILKQIEKKNYEQDS